MKLFICMTCGTQYPASEQPPEHCLICEDDRQYVHPLGQRWTTLEELQQTHRNHFEMMEPGVTSITMEPSFAIGWTAFLIQTKHGNILWETHSLIDDETIERIRQLGGVQAISLSHPHYYSSMIEWSRAFDAPIYLPAADRKWVMRPDPAVEYWDGDTLELLPGVTLIRSGGHFPGAAVLHWPDGAEGRGVMFTGDTIQVVADRRWVTFMYSYPNIIPLDATTVRSIVASVEPYAFDRIYGAFGRNVLSDAKGAVRRSADRYIRQIHADL